MPFTGSAGPDASGGGFLLSWLLWLVPRKCRRDTQEFIRASIVMLSPALLTVANLLAMYDQPLLQPALTLLVLLNTTPFVLWITGSTRIAGVLCVVVEYVISYRAMEVVSPEFGYATPAFFLPLAGALLVGTAFGLVSGVLSVYMVLLAPFGVLPFPHITADAVPLCEQCVDELAFRGVLNNMFVIVAVGLLYSWLNDAAVRRLQFMNQLSQQFFAVICHELRGPCESIVKGTQQLSRSSNLTGDQRSIAAAIDLSGQSLAALLSDVLDFEKIEQGELQLVPEPVLVRTLVEGVVEMAALSGPARPSPVELVCHVAPGVPAAVRADPKRLRQVFMNLISNALKFTERGAIVVTLTAETAAPPTVPSTGSAPPTVAGRGRAPPPQPLVTLHAEVRDTGIGIASDQQAKLFQPFTTIIREETSKRQAGTGLGLSVCRKLVRMMDGEITVQSARGAGSAFHATVRVPVCSEAEVLDKPPDLSLDTRSLRGLRVAVALPEPMAAGEVASMLRELDVQADIVPPPDIERLVLGGGWAMVVAERDLAEHLTALLARAGVGAQCKVIGVVRGGTRAPILDQFESDIAGPADSAVNSAPMLACQLVRPITQTRLADALLRAAGRVSATPLLGIAEHPHASLTRMAISASVLQPAFYARPSVLLSSAGLSREPAQAQAAQPRTVTRRRLSMPDVCSPGPLGAPLGGGDPGWGHAAIVAPDSQAGGRCGGPGAPGRTLAVSMVALRRHSIATASPSALAAAANMRLGGDGSPPPATRHRASSDTASTPDATARRDSGSMLGDSGQQPVVDRWDSGPGTRRGSAHVSDVAEPAPPAEQAPAGDRPAVVDVIVPQLTASQTSVTAEAGAAQGGVTAAAVIQPDGSPSVGGFSVGRSSHSSHSPGSAQSTGAAAAAAAAAAAGPLTGQRVLVVDDTMTSRFITVRMLKHSRPSALLGVGSGEEAVHEVQQRCPHWTVYILDMYLGDMTGVDVARAIRRAETERGTAAAQRAVLVALSGDATMESEALADELVDVFLVKPASQEQIQQAVLDTLARRRAC